MKRKITIAIVLIVLFSIGAGIIYLNNVYLPVKIKGRLASTLSSYLNYNVEIGALKFSPIRGFLIQDFVVYNNVKDKDNTILTVKEASCHVLFLPFIKERKVIIPLVHIDSPYLNIRYQKDNAFNFSKIFLSNPKSAQPQPKSKLKFSFLIYKINILNGSGAFRDQRFTPEFTKTFQDLNIVLGISPIANVAFFIDGKVIEEKGAIAMLSIRGNYNFLSKELNSKINLSNLVITEFNQYLKSLPVFIAYGTLDNAALELKCKNKLVSLKGVLPARGVEIRKNNLAISGDINLEPDLTYARDKKSLDYKTNIKFIQASLTGIKYIEKISNISGDIGVVKNKIWTDNLKLQAMDSVFDFKGVFENFSNPYIKFNLKSEQTSLGKILSIFPSKPKGLSLSGQATADISIEGNLGRPPLGIKATLVASAAKLQAPFLKEPLDNIKGKFEFTQNSIVWTDISFDYLKTPYASTGKLIDFKIPEITFGINSGNFDLKSDIKLKDKGIRIITFIGKYLNSKFDVEGLIDTQDKENPDMNLTVNQLLVSPPDAFTLLPPGLSEKLKNMKLEGPLNITGTLAGKIKDYKKWDISLKAASDALSFYNLKFDALAFLLEEKDGVINLNHFTASGYSGSVGLSFIANLKSDPQVYALKFSGSGIDLAKLKLDTGLKNKDFSGMLNFNADLNGDFQGLSSLKGNGLISIKDGKLWELNLFKGLGQLFLISDFEKITFKDALGNFNVADKAVSTDNLKLTSDQLTLDCKGKLGFDGALDFTLYTQANDNLIRDSTDIRKFTAAIIGNLGDAITIKISGTIQKPKYNIVPLPMNVIKNLKDFLLGK